MEKLWFKAKKYGYGWIPVTWEGWLTLLLFLVLMTLGTATAQELMSTAVGNTLVFITGGLVCYIALLFAGLIAVCSSHGEEAKWRWGDDD